MLPFLSRVSISLVVIVNSLIAASGHDVLATKGRDEWGGFTCCCCDGDDAIIVTT